MAPYCDAHFLPPCEKKLLKSLRASVRQTVSAWDKLARNVWIYHRNTLNKEREKACTFFFFFERTDTSNLLNADFFCSTLLTVD